MLEGALVLLAVVPCPTEREMDRDDVALVDRDPERRVHALHVFVGQDPILDVRERPPCIAVFGIDRRGAAIGGNRLIVPAGPAQAVAVSEPNPGILRVTGDELLMLAKRVLVAAELVQDQRLRTAELEVADFLLEDADRA